LNDSGYEEWGLSRVTAEPNRQPPSGPRIVPARASGRVIPRSIPRWDTPRVRQGRTSRLRGGPRSIRGRARRPSLDGCLSRRGLTEVWTGPEGTPVACRWRQARHGHRPLRWHCSLRWRRVDAAVAGAAAGRVSVAVASRLAGALGLVGAADGDGGGGLDGEAC